MTVNLKEEYKKMQVSKQGDIYEIAHFLTFYGIENANMKLNELFDKPVFLFQHRYLNQNEINYVFEFFQKTYKDKNLIERFIVYSNEKYCIGTLKSFIEKLGYLITYHDIELLLGVTKHSKILPNSFISKEQVKTILDYYEYKNVNTSNPKEFYIDIFNGIQTVYLFTDEEIDLLKKFFNGGRFLKNAVFETIKKDFT